MRIAECERKSFFSVGLSIRCVVAMRMRKPSRNSSDSEGMGTRETGREELSAWSDKEEGKKGGKREGNRMVGSIATKKGDVRTLFHRWIVGSPAMLTVHLLELHVAALQSSRMCASERSKGRISFSFRLRSTRCCMCWEYVVCV